MTATIQPAQHPEAAPRPFALIDPEKQLEWVNGHAGVKELARARHSRIGMRLSTRLNIFVEAQNLGAVYGPDATFTIGQRERIPDIAFVSAARIPPEGDPISPWKIAPDLAVEIVSPNDLIEEIETKLSEYFAAGVKQVWLVSPQLQTVSVYDAPEVFGTAMNVAHMVNRSTWNCVVTVIPTAQFVIRHAWQEPERAILPLPSMSNDELSSRNGSCHCQSSSVPNTSDDALNKVTILQADDELTSPTLLPGFRCSVAELFRPLTHPENTASSRQ